MFFCNSDNVFAVYFVELPGLFLHLLVMLQVVLKASVEACRKRNTLRESLQRVPDEVIHRMASRIEYPEEVPRKDYASSYPTARFTVPGESSCASQAQSTSTAASVISHGGWEKYTLTIQSDTDAGRFIESCSGLQTMLSFLPIFSISFR